MGFMSSLLPQGLNNFLGGDFDSQLVDSATLDVSKFHRRNELVGNSFRQLGIEYEVSESPLGHVGSYVGTAAALAGDLLVVARNNPRFAALMALSLKRVKVVCATNPIGPNKSRDLVVDAQERTASIYQNRLRYLPIKFSDNARAALDDMEKSPRMRQLKMLAAPTCGEMLWSKCSFKGDFEAACPAGTDARREFNLISQFTVIAMPELYDLHHRRQSGLGLTNLPRRIELVWRTIRSIYDKGSIPVWLERAMS